MNEVIAQLDKWIQSYNENVGGQLLLIFLIPTGLYFTIRFRLLQLRALPHALKVISGAFDRPEDAGDINHFRALTTALSATIGIGNIVGVALAIYWGGPGAIFWMWVTGFLGMILKFVECTLSFKFRVFNEDGTVSGGPMYYMSMGLREKLGPFAGVLAGIFAAATMLSALGQGNMAQSHSIADALHSSYGVPTWLSGLLVSALVLLVIVGGIRRIAEVTSKLVPFMAILYFAGGALVIIANIGKVPESLLLIVKSAFTGTAATGGFIGASFIITLRYGVARGIFSNEAGQGSAAIAHAAAKTKYPVREGLVASVGPFVDTIIVCSITALVIILTGAWTCGKQGVTMTVEGFARGFSGFGLRERAPDLVTVSLILFAFSTIIGWSYYGSRAAQYLFGSRAIRPYFYLYGLFVFLGSLGKIEVVWHFTDMAVTFMTIPNLIALLLLGGLVAGDMRSYFEAMRRGDD